MVQIKVYSNIRIGQSKDIRQVEQVETNPERHLAVSLPKGDSTKH